MNKMKQKSKLISIVSFFGLIQSLVWMGLAITGALVYLCIIPVNPYVDSQDFFRVTFVKLYFEGRRRKLDGYYLGQLNLDYKNPDKISLLSSDIIFACMVAHFILQFFYFFSCCQLHSRRKVKTNSDIKSLLCICKSWSALTLLLCIFDAFLLVSLIFDFFSLHNYVANMKLPKPPNIEEVPYVALVFAFISSRCLIIWIWNLIIGSIFFLKTVCMNKVPGITAFKEEEKKPEVKKEEQQPEPSKQNQRLPDWERYRYSLEAVTNFNENSPEKVAPYRESHYQPQREPAWYPPPPSRYGRKNEEWGLSNEGYIQDEQRSLPPDAPMDFEHNLKNFEQGGKGIKIVKPPLGKPVSIPVPPPLPYNESYNC